MRRRWIIGGAIAALVGGIYLNNASWLAPRPDGTPGVLAHRGVHQIFRREGLTEQTCTATRILPPANPYLENTILSMRASLAAGATALEFDIHPTTDGEFAVFHDWTLECRTNGHGVTRQQSMAYLKTLDIGYGYTADGGKTFPFRGRGVGLMPTLDEVLTAFPGEQFLINIKSHDPSESERLVAYLKAHRRPIDDRLWVWAVGEAGERLRQLAPQARVMDRPRIKDCTLKYFALGWSGYVPESCRGGVIAVPLGLRRLYWGWPNRFLARMNQNHVAVFLSARVARGRDQEETISRVDELDEVPEGFNGTIVTDYIETIGPEARRRWGEGR